MGSLLALRSSLAPYFNGALTIEATLCPWPPPIPRYHPHWRAPFRICTFSLASCTLVTAVQLFLGCPQQRKTNPKSVQAHNRHPSIALVALGNARKDPVVRLFPPPPPWFLAKCSLATPPPAGPAGRRARLRHRHHRYPRTKKPGERITYQNHTTRSLFFLVLFHHQNRQD